MDLAVDAAIPAAIVATLSAGVAIWQTTLARSQAQIARDAAESTRRQAAAADEQVELMRRQLSLDQDQRNDARRPKFDTSGMIAAAGVKKRHGVITIKQSDGAALQELNIRGSGNHVEGLRSPQSKILAPLPEENGYLAFGASSVGTAVGIRVDLEPGWLESVYVELEFLAIARDDGHQWTEFKTVWLPAPNRPTVQSFSYK